MVDLNKTMRQFCHMFSGYVQNPHFLLQQYLIVLIFSLYIQQHFPILSNLFPPIQLIKLFIIISLKINIIIQNIYHLLPQYGISALKNILPLPLCFILILLQLLF